MYNNKMLWDIVVEIFYMEMGSNIINKFTYIIVSTIFYEFELKRMWNAI